MCLSEDYFGMRVFYKERFLISDGKVYFVVVEYCGLVEILDEDYLFFLMIVRYVGYYYIFMMIGRSRVFVKRWFEFFVEIYFEDVERFGIKIGDWVKIVIRRGEYLIRVKVMRIVKKGVIVVFWYWGVNVVINDVFDLVVKILEIKVCVCKVVKIMEEEVREFMKKVFFVILEIEIVRG